MHTGTISIDFLENSSSDANKYAQDLEGALAPLDPTTEITRETKPGSQEIVSSLVVLFGTPVAGVLAGPARDAAGIRRDARHRGGEDRHDPSVMVCDVFTQPCSGQNSFYRIGGPSAALEQASIGDQLAGHRSGLCNRDGGVEVLRWSDL